MRGLTILMPCLNEELTIETCIQKAKGFLSKYGMKGEILIADNGSTDSSIQIAKNAGARVVNISERGYGSALRGGILASKYEYIIMGDADDSYDFSNLDMFIKKLDDGYDLVMGNRFQGGIENGAMPFSHRYIGNPVLSGIGRLFYKSKIGDFHCGLRAFRRDKILELGLCTTGMEFASEMVVKSSLHNLNICEIPCKLYLDGRNRTPHLRSIPDGFRHLKFLLIYSPKWLFLYPGLLMSVIGLAFMIIIFFHPIQIGGVRFEVATMFYAAMVMLLGMQLIQFSLYTNIFARRIGQFPSSSKFVIWMQDIMTKRGIIIALIVMICGGTGILVSVYIWSRVNFGALNGTNVHRLAILSGVIFLLGIQLLFSAFFTSVLEMGKTNEEGLNESGKRDDGKVKYSRFTGFFHNKLIYDRRMERLSQLISEMLIGIDDIIDIGCGDGKIDRLIIEKSGVQIRGLDVLVRDKTYIDVQKYDGEHIPIGESKPDAIMAIDVLHHTDAPQKLVEEMVRQTGKYLIIKDHYRTGIISYLKLRIMDYVGNAHYNVRLPYNYLTPKEWVMIFEQNKIRVIAKKEQLNLYGGGVPFSI